MKPRTALIVILLAMAIAGCRRGASQPPPASSARTDNRSSPPPAYLAPTPQEGYDFAEAYQLAVHNGDVQAATQLIDWEAVMQTATRGIEASPEFEQAFQAGARRQAQQGVFGQQLADAVASGGSFRFLRIHSEGHEIRALFRLVQPEVGVNYHDYILAKRPDGTIVASDVYIFLSAERLSRSLRRMYLMAVASKPQTLLRRVLGQESGFVQHATEFAEMASAFREGEQQRVMEIYAGLPTEMQHEKSVMLLQVQAAAQLDDDQYVQAIDAFRQQHPRDPCLDMISIDGFLLRRQYDEALRAIDRLDASVGGDPYCHVLRGNIYLEQQQVDAAKAAYQSAIELDPQLDEGYWSLITVSLLKEDFAETARLLDRVSQQLGIDFVDLRQVPEYAGFVQSPEYQQWLSGRQPPE